MDATSNFSYMPLLVMGVGGQMDVQYSLVRWVPAKSTYSLHPPECFGNVSFQICEYRPAPATKQMLRVEQRICMDLYTKACRQKGNYKNRRGEFYVLTSVIVTIVSFKVDQTQSSNDTLSNRNHNYNMPWYVKSRFYTHPLPLIMTLD